MQDRLNENCGIFGIAGHQEAANMTYLGLHALQHRGQESAGIASTEGYQIHLHRQAGLVGDIFDPEKLRTLRGSSAIGQVRYSSRGTFDLRHAQPLSIEYAQGSLAICHNGSFLNAQNLRDTLESHGSVFQSLTDTEVILHLMAICKAPELYERVIYALSKVCGAYSMLFLSLEQLIAARGQASALTISGILLQTGPATHTRHLLIPEKSYLLQLMPDQPI